MNLQKATQKSIEALQSAQSLATASGNQQMEQAHLLLALLSTPDGLVGTLLEKMGIAPLGLTDELRATIDKLPKVSGSREAD